MSDLALSLSLSVLIASCPAFLTSKTNPASQLMDEGEQKN